jgi:hypothetical protein
VTEAAVIPKSPKHRVGNVLAPVQTMRQIMRWTPRHLVPGLTALLRCSGGDTAVTPEPAPAVSVTPGAVTLEGIGAECEVSAKLATPAGAALTWASDRPRSATGCGG